MFYLDVIIPNHETEEEVAIEPGTTVTDVAQRFGLANASQIPAINGAGNQIGPNHVLTEEDGPVISFIYKLAGA